MVPTHLNHLRLLPYTAVILKFSKLYSLKKKKYASLQARYEVVMKATFT